MVYKGQAHVDEARGRSIRSYTVAGGRVAVSVELIPCLAKAVMLYD